MDTIYIKVYICEVSFREFFLNIQILKILKNGYSSGTYLYSIGTSVSKPHRRKYILHHQEKRNCAKLYFLHKLECIYLPFTYLTDKICRRKYFYLFIVLTLKKRVFVNDCFVKSWNNMFFQQLLRNYCRKVVLRPKLLCAISVRVRSNLKFRNRSRRLVIISEKLFSTLGSCILEYRQI